jgi:hypothetical protein
MAEEYYRAPNSRMLRRITTAPWRGFSNRSSRDRFGKWIAPAEWKLKTCSLTVPPQTQRTSDRYLLLEPFEKCRLILSTGSRKKIAWDVGEVER